MNKSYQIIEDKAAVKHANNENKSSKDHVDLVKAGLITYKDGRYHFTGDPKAYKRYYKNQKKDDARAKRNEKAKQKAKKREQIRNYKLQIKHHAKSRDFRSDAENYLMNNRSFYDEKDVAKMNAKLQDKYYRKLLREYRSFLK